MIFSQFKKVCILSVALCFVTLYTIAQEAKTPAKIKVTKCVLDNGLTVLLNEDHTIPLVYGGVVTKAGSKNDPSDHTGIAHYLEHMLFKGTEEMGTTDFEKEKPFLENIYALYDSLGQTVDENKRKEIQKKINEQSLKAGEYAIPIEIDKLIKSIGGSGMNAFTAEEMTFFYNAFPPNQFEKWLELYSHRFTNPVFRSFQSELEVVYEEKNRSMDNFGMKLIETFLANLYKKHPYGQQTAIGTIEHLKNPSLNAMYKFYKTYYVANNMALVICGDFNTDEILPIIKEKFGTWKSGTVPEFPKYDEKDFNGREVVEVKLTPIKLGIIGFRTVPNGNTDEVALDVCNRILSNTGQTGLLDKLVLDNKLMAAQYIPLGQNNDYGASVFLFIPKILGQSLENAEQLIMSEFDSLRNGKFDDWLLEAVKKDIYTEFKLNLENFDNRTTLIAQAFAQSRDIDDYLNYPDKIKKITKEDVIKAAQKYYNKNYLIMLSKMGFPKKEKLDKPGYEPVKPKQDAKSPFAKKFETMKAKEPVADFVNFGSDVQVAELAKDVTLYYTPNPENDIYTLKIKFGVGKYKMPQLYYAAELMNYAGTKTKSLNEVKKAFQKTGCSYSFSCDDNYLTAELTGIESELKAGVILLQELLSEPVVDKEKIKNIVEGEQATRKLEDADAPGVAQALLQYVRKKNNSTFINRLSMKEIKALNADSLLAVFKKGLTYEVQVHYTGSQYSFADVSDILKSSLQFQSNLKTSESPVVINDEVYNENTVYFVNRKDAVQSQIYFYIKGEDYSIDKEAYIDAFNDYFGGGFSGLVIQEIREYRSMAYTAAASYSIPMLTGKRSSFIGYVGTQADKTVDAIQVFDSLICFMPEKKERIENIRSSLVQEAYASRPDFRELTEKYLNWKLKGYIEDPSKYKLETYKNLTFDDIVKFYNTSIKGKPIVICIVGDKKRLNMTDIAKFGKIVEVKESSLFKK
ncbi:MAG TPA: insulinase family protein [Bacteroidales bacterium]|nr:insulinase family protein [Bacteroidales bacterium]HPS17550.1 insulinase family protein [Bacteroidales bacterium]